MLFYHLVIARIIKYFKLDELFNEDERRLILLKKKKKEEPKLELKIDKKMNYQITILLTILSALIVLSIPFAGLDDPCDCFVKEEMYALYEVCRYAHHNSLLLDLIIITLFVLLFKVTYDMLTDAIANTDISISPWVLRGKYKIEKHVRETCHWCLKKKYADFYNFAEYYPDVARELRRVKEYQKYKYDQRLEAERLKKEKESS